MRRWLAISMPTDSNRSDFSLRYEMGVTLTKTGSLDEAEEQL